MCLVFISAVWALEFISMSSLRIGVGPWTYTPVPHKTPCTHTFTPSGSLEQPAQLLVGWRKLETCCRYKESMLNKSNLSSGLNWGRELFLIVILLPLCGVYLFFFLCRLRRKCIKNLDPSMKKASRSTGASSKTTTATKPTGKPEPSGTMGTGGKSTAKNQNSAHLSKVSLLEHVSFSVFFFLPQNQNFFYFCCNTCPTCGDVNQLS